MNESIKAVLVEARPGSFDRLRLALEAQSLKVFIAKNCVEAALSMWSACPPHLVFTDVHLTDGSWEDLLALAAQAPVAVNVIVVAPFVDVPFYIQAIERGAYDFIVPPLEGQELEHVVRTAAENVMGRRRRPITLLRPASLVDGARPESAKATTV
jgi:DNA-binding NtrC family response regulator